MTRRARGRLPAHRHRRDVRQRAGRRRGDPRVRARPRRRLRHEQAEQRLPPARRRARARSTQTLTELGTDYVDLFLIHWPLPTLYDGDFVSTWQTLEEFQRDGRARSIGVSNFQVAHLERLAAETDVVPPSTRSSCIRTSRTARSTRYGRAHGIATEAWSPIAQGKVLDDPMLDRDRRAARQVAGAGRPALAHPARQHRLPEVGHARADQGELRAVRLRARAATTSSRSTRSTGARPGATARTRTCSPTSPS